MALRANLAHLHLGAEPAQHALGVIACGFRLDHLGPARSVQSRQQHRRFHLRRGLGQPIGDVLQPAALQCQRQPPAGPADPARPHQPQRRQHPVHRPPPQRGVAGKGRGHRKPGRRAHDQPHPGAGVAAVDHIRRLGEPARALDPPDPFAAPLDGGPERRHRGRRPTDVLAFQQPLDLGDAAGQRPQDQRPMADRLVAGRAHHARQGAGTAGDEVGRAHPGNTPPRLGKSKGGLL